MKDLLNVFKSNTDLNKVKISYLTLQDLDFLSLAYYRTWETRIEKKGFTDEFKRENLHYWLPFYTFIGFYIDRNFPNTLFSKVKSLFEKKDTNTKNNNPKKEKGLCDKSKGKLVELKDSIKSECKNNDKSEKCKTKKLLEAFIILIPSFGDCYLTQYNKESLIEEIKQHYEENNESKNNSDNNLENESIEKLKEKFLKQKVKEIIKLAFLENLSSEK